MGTCLQTEQHCPEAGVYKWGHTWGCLVYGLKDNALSPQLDWNQGPVPSLQHNYCGRASVRSDVGSDTSEKVRSSTEDS